MNKLCNDNWFEILLFLNYDDIQNLRKSRLLDDSKWKIYVELNLLKKYPSIYQDLITIKITGVKHLEISYHLLIKII